jgi:protein required for attachment to host cells
MTGSRVWYVIADGGRARILLKRKTQDAYDTQQEFVDPDIHRHTRDLGAERPGRGRESANAAHHAVEPRRDLHQAGKQAFVEEVARMLSEANAQGAFDRLILVAPAHALADLDHALDPATKSKVAARLRKDLTNIPNADLAKHLVGLDSV